MNLIQAIIMGIIQGLAEFLPISSSGHLAIGKEILGINVDTGLLFDVLLHLGTLVAICIAFWEDVRSLVIEGFSIIGDLFVNLGIAISRFFALIKRTLSKKETNKKEYRKMITTPYRRFVLLIILSTIPTVIIALPFKDFIEKASNGIIVPGVCLLITAILLLIADNCKKGDLTEETVTYKKATLVGVAQGIATLPGISRSGTTITACLLCGYKKEFAVKYSFIMSIPAVLGSVVLELKDFNTITFSSGELVNYIVGTIVAGVVGYICIITMLKIVRNKKFFGFSIYCFIVGLIAITYYFIH